VRDFAHGAVGKLNFYLLAHKTSIATAAANPGFRASVLCSLGHETVLQSRYRRHGTKLALQKACFRNKVVRLTADAALVCGGTRSRVHSASFRFLPTGFNNDADPV
jgi:hypothetical protein